MAGRVNGASARKSRNSIHAMPVKWRTPCTSHWRSNSGSTIKSKTPTPNTLGNCTQGLVPRASVHPFSNRTSVTRPTPAARASASWDKPAGVAEPPDALAQRKPPPHGYGLNSRAIGCVTIVTGEVPGYLDRRALGRLQNHLVRVGQLQRGQGRTLSRSHEDRSRE